MSEINHKIYIPEFNENAQKKISVSITRSNNKIDVKLKYNHNIPGPDPSTLPIPKFLLNKT